ncbi:MAG: Lipopolysaccharide kinase (Kdo/WaaP) family protein [Nitrospira sp. OLB3]|nr:MAG: Lipopolysaccharide kinase (Kdo/WaaP) family protein [Nitrospira sp. OLB3]
MSREAEAGRHAFHAAACGGSRSGLWGDRGSPIRRSGPVSRVMAVTPFGSSPVPPGFERRSHSSLAWVVRASVDDPALAHLLCDPETHLAHSPRIFKNEGRCVVALVGGYVMKRWSGYGGLERWKTRWRGTRAARAGWAATALEQAGVATVPVLAWGTREGVIGAPSYLLMAYLADAVDLRSWQGNRLEMAERLGGLIGLLHERGFTHRDLKPSNLLVTPDAARCSSTWTGCARSGRCLAAGPSPMWSSWGVAWSHPPASRPPRRRDSCRVTVLRAAFAIVETGGLSSGKRPVGTTNFEPYERHGRRALDRGKGDLLRGPQPC